MNPTTKNLTMIAKKSLFGGYFNTLVKICRNALFFFEITLKKISIENSKSVTHSYFHSIYITLGKTTPGWHLPSRKKMLVFSNAYEYTSQSEFSIHARYM